MYQLENWPAGKRHNLACYRRKRNNLRAGVAFQSLNTKFSEPYERAAIARARAHDIHRRAVQLSHKYFEYI